MKKLLVAAAASALLASGIGAAVAQPTDANGNYGNYGLCNAYFRGSEKGQAQKQSNGQAFVRLRNAAADWDGDGDSDNDDVAAYCAELFPKPGNGGGKP